MSRKRKRTDLQEIKIKRSGYSHKHESFGRFYDSTALSPQFQALSVSARYIYLLLIIQCGKEDQQQRIRCKFPESVYTLYGMKHRTMTKAVSELEEGGFIQVWRYHSKIPNEYMLIDTWKTEN